MHEQLLRMNSRRRWTAVAVLASLLAACGGSSPDEPDVELGSATTTPTATATASEPEGAVTTEAPGATVTAAPSSGAPSTTARPSAGQGSSTTTSTAASTATTTPGPVPGGAAAQPLAPGTYRYAQSGTATSGGATRTVPAEGTLVVEAPSSTGKQVTRRFVDPAKKPSDQELLFSDGIFITKTTDRINVGQQYFEVSCTFNPGLPAPPWPPAVGATYGGSGSCGGFTVEASGSISEKRTVPFEGADLEIFVMDTTVTTKGSVQSTIRQVEWFAPSLRMSVHVERQVDGTYGISSYSSKVVSDLKSAQPAAK
jgi:hypothetical protein